MTALIFDHRPRLTWGGVRQWWDAVDRPLLACAFFLIALGIVLNFATSPALAARNGVEPFYYVTRQAIFAIPSVLLMLALSMASPKVIRRFGVVLFCATIALLMLVLLVGASRNGSQRWLSLVFFSLQPSELVKPALIAASAWMFSVKDEPNAPPGAMVAAGCLAITAFLVALQPDYSQTALICAVWGLVFFLSGASIIWAASGGLLAIGGGAIAYATSPYVAERLRLMVDLDSQSGYQMRRTIAAIREGGLWGTGPGEGVQKLGLPDAHSDFIIAVAAEEYGLLLTLVIIAVYAFVVVRGFLLASTLKSIFARLAVSGVSALIGLQAFIHIGVSARLLPPTGMTLPLVSYGGSSLMAMGITFGFLLGLTRLDMERLR